MSAQTLTETADKEHMRNVTRAHIELISGWLESVQRTPGVRQEVRLLTLITRATSGVWIGSEVREMVSERGVVKITLRQRIGDG